MVAEMGNVGSCLFSSMHDHAAFNNVYLFAVEFDFNHLGLRLIVGLDQAGLVLYEVLKFVPVMFDHGANRHSRSIAQGTDRTTHDVFRHVVQ